MHKYLNTLEREGRHEPRNFRSYKAYFSSDSVYIYVVKPSLCFSYLLKIILKTINCRCFLRSCKKWIFVLAQKLFSRNNTHSMYKVNRERLLLSPIFIFGRKTRAPAVGGGVEDVKLW